MNYKLYIDGHIDTGLSMWTFVSYQYDKVDENTWVGD